MGTLHPASVHGALHLLEVKEPQTLPGTGEIRQFNQGPHSRQSKGHAVGKTQAKGIGLRDQGPGGQGRLQTGTGGISRLAEESGGSLLFGQRGQMSRERKHRVEYSRNGRLD